MSAANKPLRHWWLSARLLLRFGPLYAAMAAAALLARISHGRWRVPRAQFRPGVSIVIPERGTPELLAQTLSALNGALTLVSEPTEVVVVINGAATADYITLMRQYPNVQWQHFDHALGYNGAIAAGLKWVRYDWVYLLNSDMRLAPNALAELLPYRQVHIFSVSSQIFFADETRRREETGWADFVWNPHEPEVYERTPENSDLARGSLYPSGGSSLCQTSLLRRYVRDSHAYSPFYWEDVDWGVRAWGDGYEVVFCPRSHAWHHHRGTVNRFYQPQEIDRIIRRNGLLFDLRHGWSALRPGDLIHRIASLDRATQNDLARIGIAKSVFTRRLGARRARRRGLDFSTIASNKYYPAFKAKNAGRLRVLIVAPFALFPPAHGGARRIAELVARLSNTVEFILLGDERSLYGAASQPWFAHFAAIHLVEGRGDVIGEKPLPLLQRIQRHAHPKLRAELARLVAVYDPDIVQIEFMELAALVEQRQGRARWLLALHDVYLKREHAKAIDDLTQDQLIARYDAVTVCSQEDGNLLIHPYIELIANGAPITNAPYIPSSTNASLLFMGPLRYPPNLSGIREFLTWAWPRLKAQFPEITITILGGEEARTNTAGDALFEQPGVEIISRFVDPTPYLQQASLTINPQRDIRGSSLKLIESLLAGRVCVSTRDGARGFLDESLAGLSVCAGVADMIDSIAMLLNNPAARHALERPNLEQLARYGWDAIADRQANVYRNLLAS